MLLEQTMVLRVVFCLTVLAASSWSWICKQRHQEEVAGVTFVAKENSRYRMCHINSSCIYVCNAVPGKVTVTQAWGPLGVLESTLGGEKDTRIDSFREDKVRRACPPERVMGEERRRRRRQDMREAEHHRGRMERHRIAMWQEELQLKLLEIDKKLKLAQLARLEKKVNEG